jgi:plasmid maintenance system antidote protein VapI
MIVALSQRVRSLRVLAALLHVSPPTVDRVVAGSRRVQPATISRMRAALHVLVRTHFMPGVH